MAADLPAFTRKAALAGRLAGSEADNANAIGVWQGIDGNGYAVATVKGKKVRGILMASRGMPKGQRCLVRSTPQGAVIQF